MGTNHIVMWALLLGAIVALRSRRFLWSGLLASLACYKFLLIPTVLLLGIIVAARFGRRPLTRFASGGALALVPSLIYYAYDPAFFARATGNLGAIGGHSQHLEEFHVLHAFRGIPGLETTYVQGRVWFYLAVLGVVLAAALYLRKRLNTFQALGLSCGVVALVSVEPFRMEPMVGLLWMDAVHRGDRRLQGAIAVLLFTHAAAWFPLASPRYLSFFPPAAGLWEAKGLYVGVALLSVLACVLLAGGGVDLLEEPVQGPLAESREPLA
jgi:hypothetical protein